MLLFAERLLHPVWLCQHCGTVGSGEPSLAGTGAHARETWFWIPTWSRSNRRRV